MSTLFGLYPFLLKLYADSGYQGPKFQEGLKQVCGQINVEIVKRGVRHRTGRIARFVARIGNMVRQPWLRAARLPYYGAA